MKNDTLGTIVASSNASNDNVILIIIGIIMFGILLYSLFGSKIRAIFKTDKFSTSTPEENSKVGSSQNKEIKVDNPNLSYTSDNPIVKVEDVKTKSNKTTNEIPSPIIEQPIVVIEEEEESKIKYIGYNPIDIFAQTEPLYFPEVMMPKPNCVIKFPRKGRTGRKGYKEEAFRVYIEKYFKNNYQVFDDRFVLVANNSRPYEPDFTLINEKNGINIFVDIEIDEPYEGTNDIENRKPTHCKYSDIDRNYAFTNRGWIVIRFAEIQVHEQADACCQFIAHILKSIDPDFSIPLALQNISKIQPVLQWTEEEAKKWSLEKYREKYLRIDRFGITTTGDILQGEEETDIGEAIEKQVVDEEIQAESIALKKLDAIGKLLSASITGKFISCSVDNEKTIFQPTYVYDHETKGFCYVKNDSRTFEIAAIENVEIKNNYYTNQHYFDAIDDVNEISKIINNAILLKKTIRIVYTKPAWVDYFTGEITEREESERTLSDIDLSVNVLSDEHIRSYNLDENYVTGFCNTKEELRTFKFKRISKMEILDI